MDFHKYNIKEMKKKKRKKTTKLQELLNNNNNNHKKYIYSICFKNKVFLFKVIVGYKKLKEK